MSETSNRMHALDLAGWITNEGPDYAAIANQLDADFEAAEERGRRRGDAERDELRATIAELLPMAERAHHADLGKHLCPDIASLPEGLRIAREGALLLRLHHPDLVPRDSAPREVPGPFAKGEDPAKCMHAWECHVYERGKDYCPYCFSMREEVPRDSGKEP